jgi:RNA polymerase sigma factor (sigma-70 family)
MSMNEQELLKALNSDSRGKALKQLYLYFPKFKKMVIAQGGRKQDAEDIFQEAIIVLIRKVNEADFKLSSAVSTYLFAICKYMWWDNQRNSGSKLSTEELELPSNVLDDLETAVNREKQYKLAEQAFDKLGEKCREILQQFYLQRNSMKVIASKLKLKSEKVARNQKYKCLQKAHENYKNLSIS